MKNVNVCAERRGKEFLKYTFIQSLLDQTAKLICSCSNPCFAHSPPQTSPASINLHEPSPSLLRPACHLPSGQNPNYYGRGCVFLPSRRYFWRRTLSQTHKRTDVVSYSSEPLLRSSEVGNHPGSGPWRCSSSYPGGFFSRFQLAGFMEHSTLIHEITSGDNVRR